MSALHNAEMLKTLHPSFQSLVTNPAYIQVVAHFDEMSLQASSISSDIDSYGQAHIRESGIKSVFRLIEALATGDPEELNDFTPAPLETGALEDDALSLLD